MHPNCSFFLDFNRKLLMFWGRMCDLTAFWDYRSAAKKWDHLVLRTDCFVFGNLLWSAAIFNDYAYSLYSFKHFTSTTLFLSIYRHCGLQNINRVCFSPFGVLTAERRFASFCSKELCMPMTRIIKMQLPIR